MAEPLHIPVAILAGGMATRLHPLTERIPKALLPVAGKPFLAHQLELLHRQGVQRAVVCAGHMGEQIQHEFGEGRQFGVALEYSFDGPKLLGTGGAVKRALPLLGETFFVLYGDSYLLLDFRPVAEFFERSGRLGLMTVFENEGRYDTSNVRFEGGEIRIYDKKSRQPGMRHIDYGLSLFRPAAFGDFPADTPFDLAEVMQRLLTKNQLAAFEVRERFYEIGSQAGLMELEGFLRHN